MSTYFDTLIAVYTSINTPGSKNFIFNKFFNKLDMKTLFDDNFALPHECIDSTFMDKDHCHVIVSDLKIVNNNNLRNLLSNGPKYHENKIANYQKAKESTITEVKSSIQLTVINMVQCSHIIIS